MEQVKNFEEIKALVSEIAEYYDGPDEEQTEEMQRLTGVDWDPEDLQMICCGYWESPYKLEEIVYYLVHHIPIMAAWSRNRSTVAMPSMVSIPRMSTSVRASRSTLHKLSQLRAGYKGRIEHLRDMADPVAQRRGEAYVLPRSFTLLFRMPAWTM